MTQTSLCSKKEINNYINQLKSHSISHFEIPYEFRNELDLIRTERELGIREIDSCGFDVVKQIFFVKEVVHEDVDYRVGCEFTLFDEFYSYVDGDIYEKGCFYQYDFSEEINNAFNIKINNINYLPIYKDNINNYKLEKSQSEIINYEQRNSIRIDWINELCACTIYDEFYKKLREIWKKCKSRDEFEIIIFSYIFADKNKAFEFVMEYVCNSPHSCFLNGLSVIYDAEAVIKNYKYRGVAQSTSSRNRSRLKKFVNEYKKGDMPIYEIKEFNKELGLYCHSITNRKRGDLFTFDEYYVKRAFFTFEDFVEYLKGDLSGCNLLYAPINHIDLSQYKVDKNTILPIDNSVIAPLVRKYYFIDESNMGKKKDGYIVELEWKDKKNNLLKKESINFDYFCEFLAFLNFDVSSASLLECSGLVNLKKDERINWESTQLTSDIEAKLGLKKTSLKLSITKYEPDALILKNETETRLALKEDHAYGEGLLINKVAIRYVTDIHLIHRFANVDSFSEGDFDYKLNSIANSILTQYTETLLIGGDLSSNFQLFCRFINILGRKNEKLDFPATIIVVLGNHELWDFEGKSYGEIVSIYREVLSDNGMYLLEKDMMCFTDNRVKIFSYEDIMDITKNEVIKETIRSARYTLIGGNGFSGLNNDFNANNGIYRSSLDRDEEIKESCKFNEFYLCASNLLKRKKNVVVLTHTPKKDWNADEYIEGYIYVSGHNHRNEFFDDGITRIYADNQIGYKNRKVKTKYFIVDKEYDWFEDYDDGIYEISADDDTMFNRGRNIYASFTRDVNQLYMLKRGGYYCFIHKSKRKVLSILNGGSLKSLERKDIQYYYDNMLYVIAEIEKPLFQYYSVQKNISDEIKKIGGSGRIHGAIIDIDFYNHVYLNPLDMTITGYWASDIINKKVYPSITNLLENNCPELYQKYLEINKVNCKSELSIWKESERTEATVYLGTDIYELSRQIKKMQRLSKKVLTIWSDPKTKRLGKEDESLWSIV